MKIVAFVPIKLNSQRLPHKNVLPIGKHPMCWYVPNTLKSIPEIDEVYVFCSDVAVKKYLPPNVELILRDADLDNDYVKGMEIYNAFVKEVSSDVYVLAHTTSPFISSKSIFHALKKVTEEEYDSAFSAQKIQTFTWYKGKPINYELSNIPRTQDIDPVYVETSGFYIFKRDILVNYQRRIGFFPYIQEVNPIEAIDIDTKEDYEFACKLINKGE